VRPKQLTEGAEEGEELTRKSKQQSDPTTYKPSSWKARTKTSD
jgi:hypothetical protein